MDKVLRMAAWTALAAVLLLPTALTAADMGKMPAAEGQALLDYITKSDPYAKWSLMPGTTKMRQGKEPHGAMQNVHVNTLALKAINEKTGTMPDGAIIVKENYMADHKLGAVTVMYKKKGFNPDAGDWMWLRYGPDMKIQVQGKAEPCIKCHAAAKGNDYVVLAPLKK